NAANLAPGFLAHVTAKYAGTRLGRQELDAEVLEDVPGALWQRAMFEAPGARVRAAPELRRVVIALDPSGGGEDECGVIVAGVGADGHGYVLADLSGRLSPTDWARRAADAYRLHAADRIVAETNFGGDMVEATLRSVDPSVAFKKLTASRGKAVRA